uniref:Uncharacterized protein n=1 Tax=Dechloromonas aromatica (strain RCB) TaxID=159087 RepID=Q47GF5_DECAR
METDMLESQAFAYGVLFSLAIVLFFLARMATEDVIPINQRAKRLALIGGLMGVLLMATANVMIYVRVSQQLASFIVFPMVIGGCVWLMLGMPWLYRYFGGLPRTEQTEGPLIGIENETRRQQAKLWEKLRSMHHFREMLNGDLISLVTGDRIYWTTSGGVPCLAIEVASSTSLVVSRVETLVRYVEVQGNVAQLLVNAGTAKGGGNDDSGPI